MDSYERAIRKQILKSSDPRARRAVWNAEQQRMLLWLQPGEQAYFLTEQELARYPPRYAEPERYLIWDGQLKRFMSDRSYMQRTPWDFDIPNGWYLGGDFIMVGFPGDPNSPPDPLRPADRSIREFFIVNQLNRPGQTRPEGAD